MAISALVIAAVAAVVSSLVLAYAAYSNHAEAHIGNVKDRFEVSTNPESHWAVLVAGSNGWTNYRHQSDVFHAYQVLISQGVPKEQIITMAYDDIASNSRNPFPGKVYNNLDYEDVYKGVKIDYSGKEVTKENFFAVISGNKTGVEGKGTGKVLEAKADDRIFLFYSDHGSIGALCFPGGELMYADELVYTLEQRRIDVGFKELVAYVESCESGSMFSGFQAHMDNIYAMTASNAIESSWATYCPEYGMNVTDPLFRIGTCLGDLFSVAWMEDTVKSAIRREKLQEQFTKVQERTYNYGYYIGSHVMQYGDTDAEEEPVANYLSTLDVDREALDTYWAQFPSPDQDAPPAKFPPTSNTNAAPGARAPGSMPAREADVERLMLQVHYAPEGSEEKQAAEEELQAELTMRRGHDDKVHTALLHLMSNPLALYTIYPAVVNSINSAPEPLVFRRSRDESPAAYANRVAKDPATASVLSFVTNARIPPNPSAPVESQQAVADWDCLRGMVNTWETSCGPLGEYGMKYTRLFANLCNSGLRPGALESAARATCVQGPVLAAES